MADIIKKIKEKYLTPASSPADGIVYWREKIFLNIIMTFVIIGFLTLIPSNILAWQTGLKEIFLINIAAFLIFLGVLILRNIALNIRIYITLILIYILSAVLLFKLGPFGSGFFYLFSFPVFAGILLGRKSVFIALSINFLTLLALGIMLASGPIWNTPAQASFTEQWLVNGINFMFLNIVAAVSLAVIIEALESTAEKNLKSRMQLLTEKDKLSKTNKLLYAEFEKRQKAQIALYESESKFETIFNEAADGMILHGPDGKIIGANRLICEYTGYSKEELLKSRISDIKGADGKPLFNISPGLLKKRGFIKSEDSFVRIGGEKIYVDIRANIVSIGGGQRALYIVRDITESKIQSNNIIKLNEELESRVSQRTRQFELAIEELKKENEERKRAEHELLITQKELIASLEKEKELSALKSNFVTMVSHEYRTPLTIILSSAHLLERYYETRDTEKFNKHIGQISNSVNLMAGLLTKALDYDKAQAAGFGLNPAEFDIVALIEETIEEIKTADEGRHEFEFITDETNFDMLSNRAMVKNILMNLLNNSSKYAPVNSTARVFLGREGDYIKISVTDGGPGISEEEKEEILKPYYKSAIANGIDSSGVGLSIVKSYMAKLKGRLEIISPNKPPGLEVRLFFPISPIFGPDK